MRLWQLGSQAVKQGVIKGVQYPVRERGGDIKRKCCIKCTGGVQYNSDNLTSVQHFGAGSLDLRLCSALVLDLLCCRKKGPCFIFNNDSISRAKLAHTA